MAEKYKPYKLNANDEFLNSGDGDSILDLTIVKDRAKHIAIEFSYFVNKSCNPVLNDWHYRYGSIDKILTIDEVYDFWIENIHKE